MPVPTAYTEIELAEFMHGELGALSGVLGWTVAAGSYTQAVYAALRLYGVEDIAEATDAGKLEAAARIALWQAAAQATVGFVDVDLPDDISLQRSQAHTQAKEQYAAARRDGFPYGLRGYAVTSATIIYADDPYRVRSSTELGQA